MDFAGQLNMVGRGGSLADHEDVNRAMIEEAAKFIPALIDQAQKRQQGADLAEAQALYVKHGRYPN